ncbi:hypothetical protein EYF80_006640 [Liparis tanakae]|uniref:Uncharacterized protein n=1 Tax=Liparis tanakae TaxID=230148 RepID=A0A4Z2J0P7_9TELE|nr:hypothetical protein EYF80_006640 [Liparis tanakae]
MLSFSLWEGLLLLRPEGCQIFSEGNLNPASSPRKRFKSLAARGAALLIVLLTVSAEVALTLITMSAGWVSMFLPGTVRIGRCPEAKEDEALRPSG